MTKKESELKIIGKGEFKNPKLKPGQYWEWRATMYELDIGRLHLKLNEEAQRNLRKDLTIAQLQFEKGNIANGKLKAKYKQLENNYLQFTEKLEKDLKCSFKNKIIDPITFEIMSEEDLK